MTDAVIVSLITGSCTVVVSAIAAYFSRQTHNAVNSRLDKFLEMSKKSFKADGKLEGQAEQKAADRGERKLAGALDKTASKHPRHD